MASHMGVSQQQTDQPTTAPKIQNKHWAAARVTIPTSSKRWRVTTPFTPRTVGKQAAGFMS
jgi:hypothetical protein